MGQNPAVPHHTRYVSLLRLRTLAHIDAATVEAMERGGVR